MVLLISMFSLLLRSKSPSFGWEGTFKPDWKLDIQGKNGAVASDNSLCSQMGVEVLKQGGSAADAAVQVCLCLGSLSPQSAGIGGGSFATVRFPNGSTLVIDSRETAPLKAHKHMFDNNPLKSKIFGLASGVPGELAGLETLWKLGGKLSWSELVLPVADLNEKGFLRSDVFSHMENMYRDELSQAKTTIFDEIIASSDWCWLFTNHALCKGQSTSTANWIKRPQLAKTLRKIAYGGADVFYNGEIAQNLVDITTSTGGILTMDDFANYKVIVRETISTTFLNKTLFTAPEPASGPALVMGLNAMEQLLLESEDPRDLDEDPLFVHRAVEVMKWMAAARSELGDPDFIDNPKISKILSADWASSVVRNVSDKRSLPSWRDYHPSFEMNSPKGTSHFSVLDKDGMAVSMTTTVNLPFGNGVCDPVTGVVMNSEMDDFSVPKQKNSFELAPSVYNFVEPGKRPLSSSVPSIFVDSEGNVELVIGAAGGSRILTAVFYAILRKEALNLEPLEVVAFPRLHHQLIPEQLMFESGHSKELINSLAGKGHEVEERIPMSALNLIHRDAEGMFHAIGDFYRKRGLGAAY